MNRLVSQVRSRSESLLQRVKMPERFKGTMVENWARYWKNLMRDYRDVYQDTATTVRTEPGKAAAYVALLVAGGAAIKKAPDGRTFRTRVIEARDEVCYVAQKVRNPEALEYVTNLERLSNQGRIRHVSLLFFSLCWIADVNDDLALPYANCDFLQPAWATWHQRIIDVGFGGKFWNLERRLQDFDVNPAEWESGDR